MRICRWLRRACFKITVVAVLILVSHVGDAVAQPPKWQLGKIAHKSTRDTLFTVIARKQPIILANIKSNCSCLRVEVSKRAVQIGDTLKIKLRYNAKDKGFFYKKVELNGRGLEWNEIVVRGEVQ